jgi:hypothetical protein
MIESEIQERIAAAEKDPSLLRQLIADIRAWKDEQLSDLTGQVNAYRAANESKQAEVDAKQAEVDAKEAERLAALAREAEARKPELLKRREALEAQKAAIDKELSELPQAAIAAEEVRK